MRMTTGLLGALLLAGCGGAEPEPVAENAAAPLSAPAADPAPANLAAPEPAPEAAAAEEAPDAAEKAPEEQEKAAPEAEAPAPAAAPPAADATVEKAAVAAVRPASFAMCQTCHSTSKGEPHRIGPNLFGVAGAKAGSRAGYNYSDAMKGSGIVWTRDRLDAFLAAPRKVVPGTKMVIAGPKDPARRQELVDYLASLR